MKLINALNNYFLHDPGEKALLSDYWAFYSLLGISTILLITFTLLNIFN